MPFSTRKSSFSAVPQKSVPYALSASCLTQFLPSTVKLRIVGTKNIAKITKSMKMVSAAKLRGDQQRLAAATPFSAWASAVTGPLVDLENLPATDFPQKNLIVAMTTDKGLCGGVNTILSRMTRQLLQKIEADGKTYQLFVLGEKGRGQLRRAYGEKFLGSATDRQMPYTFDLASSIAQDVLAGEYDAVHLLFNRFKSAIAYIPSIKTIRPLTDPTAPFLYPFEVEPENDPETLTNFFEYTLATQIFHSMLENATSEQSSRMQAMENASKNAGEMIGKLTLQYNRARQARITTELIEIISGASALKG
jgi:F-type H+-transporting ATPase subunit gamma